MDKFNFNFRVFIEFLLPPENKQLQLISWIHCCLKKIRLMHSEFISWGGTKIEEISVSSQTIIFENYLISKFGPGIWIENIFRPELPKFGYPYSDTRNIMSYQYTNSLNKVAYEYGTFDSESVSFIVHVPSTMTFDEKLMNFYILKYNFVGADYKIQID